LFFIFFISCQSVPKITESVFEGANVLPLESGASVYILADANKARPILGVLPVKDLDNRDVKQMIDKTNFLVTAVFPKESAKRFQLVSWGNYPSSGADLALGMNSQWKKQKAPGFSYWYSSANGMSLALNAKQAFVTASAEGPVNPVALLPWLELPEGFINFRQAYEDSIIYCWIDDPTPIIQRILTSSGIPIRIPAEKLYLSMSSAGENLYEGVIRIQFENASQARAIFALLSLTSFRPDGNSPETILASLFFANLPVLNDRSLDIKTAVFNEEQIALLMRMFQVYWS
jgi:hypothetical protein